MNTGDSELLAEYRRGNRQALEQIVERYRRPLFGFILNTLEVNEEADEVFQEVWFRAIKALEHYRDKNFMSWLFRIARNLVIDRRRRRRSLSLEGENQDGIALANALASADDSAAVQAEQRDGLLRIAAALARLPAEQQEVFLLRLHGDLPFKEIAKIQKVSINTALARMQYALAKLRVLLQEKP